MIRESFTRSPFVVSSNDISGKATLKEAPYISGIPSLHIVTQLTVNKFTRRDLPQTFKVKSALITLNISGLYPVDPTLGPIQEHEEYIERYSVQGKLVDPASPLLETERAKHVTTTIRYSKVDGGQ